VTAGCGSWRGGAQLQQLLSKQAAGPSSDTGRDRSGRAVESNDTVARDRAASGAPSG